MAEYGRLNPDLFDRYLDGELSDSELAELNTEVELDPNLSFELAHFGEAVELLRQVPAVEAPSSLLWQVQQRVRRRTRNRWFTPPGTRTFVTEAAVCSVMFLATAAMYLVALPSPSSTLTKGATTAKLYAADQHLLESLGTLAQVGMSIQGDALEIELVLSKDRVQDVKRLLASHPRLEVTSTPIVVFDDSAILRIAASSGVVNTPLF